MHCRRDMACHQSALTSRSVDTSKMPTKPDQFGPLDHSPNGRARHQMNINPVLQAIRGQASRAASASARSHAWDSQQAACAMRACQPASSRRPPWQAQLTPHVTELRGGCHAAALALSSSHMTRRSPNEAQAVRHGLEADAQCVASCLPGGLDGCVHGQELGCGQPRIGVQLPELGDDYLRGRGSGGAVPSGRQVLGSTLLAARPPRTHEPPGPAPTMMQTKLTPPSAPPSPPARSHLAPRA